MIELYLEDYWPCVGGFSVVNAIDNAIARPDKLWTITRWSVAVLMVIESRKSQHQIQPVW